MEASTRAWTGEGAVDHALSLLLAEDNESALRWAAGTVENDPTMSSALIVMSLALSRMGRAATACEGLRLAVRCALAAGDLPLALAAVNGLSVAGAPVEEQRDAVANAFGDGPVRQGSGQSAAPWRAAGVAQPLNPFLTGAALTAKATQVLVAATRALDPAKGVAPPLDPLPLFGGLSREALRDVLPAFRLLMAPAGHSFIREGQSESALHVVAYGEAEASRSAANRESRPQLALVRRGRGSLFGEMSLFSRLPSAMTVVATRPSILLVAERDALLGVADQHPELGRQLAAHGKRSALANLGWASPLVAALSEQERAMLVERLDLHVFEAGAELANGGDRDERRGMYIILAGEVAMVARHWEEQVLVGTLGPGETVGEVELILCWPRRIDAVAVRPTVAMFLSAGQYRVLAHEHPRILQGLYAVAMHRHSQSRLRLTSGPSAVSEGAPHEDEVTAVRRLGLGEHDSSFSVSRSLVLNRSLGPRLSEAHSVPPSTLALVPPRRTGGWPIAAAAALAAVVASVVTLFALEPGHHGSESAAAAAAVPMSPTESGTPGRGPNGSSKEVSIAVPTDSLALGTAAGVDAPVASGKSAKAKAPKRATATRSVASVAPDAGGAASAVPPPAPVMEVGPKANNTSSTVTAGEFGGRE